MLKSRNEEPAEDPRPVAARLMASSIELVRAEAALALERGKAFSVRALTALVATVLAGAFLQVALVIGVLYPLLEPQLSGAGLAIALGVPATLGLLSLVAALVAWLGARSQA
jgi:hypothetical protein